MLKNNKEEIEEKCCKGHSATRIFVTHQNGSFGSSLNCLKCDNQDITVSLYP